MAPSEKTAKLIWGQFAGRCAVCHESVVHEGGSGSPSLVGEVAHIVGESAKAARGQSLMSQPERDAPENLMLLCRKHHKIVDDDETTYSVEQLHEIRQGHIAWIESQLSQARPWRIGQSQFSYLNVPRLLELAELGGYRVPLHGYRSGVTLHGLGWELGSVMGAFRRVLEHLELSAVPLGDITFPHDSYVGALVSFDRQMFRTKNSSKLSTGPAASDFLSGDLSIDPYIYAKRDDWRLVLPIDSNWVTTSTAFSLFQGGVTTFSGVARITRVDYERGWLMGSPLVIGIGSGLDFFTAKDALPTNRKTADANLDAMVDLETGMRRGVYYAGFSGACDLCGRVLVDGDYFVDGGLRTSSLWANMCAACFARDGKGIAWGSGQLYLRQPEGWLLVAGFRPEVENE